MKLDGPIRAHKQGREDQATKQGRSRRILGCPNRWVGNTSRTVGTVGCTSAVSPYNLRLYVQNIASTIRETIILTPYTAGRNSCRISGHISNQAQYVALSSPSPEKRRIPRAEPRRGARQLCRHIKIRGPKDEAVKEQVRSGFAGGNTPLSIARGSLGPGTDAACMM